MSRSLAIAAGLDLGALIVKSLVGVDDFRYGRLDVKSLAHREEVIERRTEVTCVPKKAEALECQHCLDWVRRIEASDLLPTRFICNQQLQAYA